METKRKEKTLSATGGVSLIQYEKLSNFCKMYNTYISRLVGIAIHNELEKDQPFKLDLTLPDLNNYVPNAFAEQAGKILHYLKDSEINFSLEMLYLVRDDIGILDKEEFLGGLKTCLDAGILETFIYNPRIKEDRYKREDVHPLKRNRHVVKDEKHFRLKQNSPAMKKKAIRKSMKDARDIAAYERVKKKLKREFEGKV